MYPPGQGRRPDDAARLDDRPLQDARRRRAPAVARGGQPRGRRPRLLQAPRPQAHRRHARRPDDEPGPRVRPLHRRRCRSSAPPRTRPPRSVASSQCVPTTANVKGAADSDGTCTPSTTTPAAARRAAARRRDRRVRRHPDQPRGTSSRPRSRPRRPATTDVVVERDGEQITLTRAARDRRRCPVLDAEDRRAHRRDRAAQLRRHRADGRAASPSPSPPCPAIMWSTLGQGRSSAIVTLPVRMVDLVRQTVHRRAARPRGHRRPRRRRSAHRRGRRADDSLPMKEKVDAAREPARRAEPVPLPVQPDPAAARSTAATSPARCGRRSSGAGRGSATSPTPARSTSPRRCPVTYVVSFVLVVMGGAACSSPTSSSPITLRLALRLTGRAGRGRAPSAGTPVGDDGRMTSPWACPRCPPPSLAERRKTPQDPAATTRPTRWRSAATRRSRCSR